MNKKRVKELIEKITEDLKAENCSFNAFDIFELIEHVARDYIGDSSKVQSHMPPSALPFLDEQKKEKFERIDECLVQDAFITSKKFKEWFGLDVTRAHLSRIFGIIEWQNPHWIKRSKGKIMVKPMDALQYLHDVALKSPHKKKLYKEVVFAMSRLTKRAA